MLQRVGHDVVTEQQQSMGKFEGLELKKKWMKHNKSLSNLGQETYVYLINSSREAVIDGRRKIKPSLKFSQRGIDL